MSSTKLLYISLIVFSFCPITSANLDFIRRPLIANSNAEAVALADLDGDGDIDAFVANGIWNQGVPNRIYINQGDGTLVDSGQLLGNLNSFDVALADLDNDGDVDAFVANGAYVGGNPNKVWLNDGHGHFTDSGQALGHNNTGGVALADLDGDGDLDAFACNHTLWQNNHNVGGGHCIWLNDGTGRFSNTGQALGTAQSRSVSLGDIDADSDIDALIANYIDFDSTFWINDGSARFTKGIQSMGTIESRKALLADLDSDGDLDAFVTHFNSQDPNGCANKVWFNRGDGFFNDSGQRLGNLPTAGIALGDLDLDGDLDAYVINSVYQETRPDEVWLNDGHGHFVNAELDLGNQESTDVALADLDGDGDLDALVATPQSLEVFINIKIHDQEPKVKNKTSGKNYYTLQKAIDIAQSGDIIEVEPGLYREILKVNKDLSLQSIDPNDPYYIGGTIIQGDANNPVLTLDNNSQACEIAGLTLRAGAVGISGTATDATIHNCRIMDNVTDGIELSEQSNPHLLNCLITANGQTGIKMLSGSGRGNPPCKPVIENCIIVDNGSAAVEGGEPVIIDSIISESAQL